jgi:phosphoribosyl-AMP cyclohydrolase
MSKPPSSDASHAVPDFAAGGGILPAIAQDSETGEVLMLAYMNEASFRETVATGQAVYFSRSRQKLWRKGEESGHRQTVEQIFVDCDADTILLKVRQSGVACHQGYRSCFFRQLTPRAGKADEAVELADLCDMHLRQERLVDPDSVYRSP